MGDGYAVKSVIIFTWEEKLDTYRGSHRDNYVSAKKRVTSD